MCTHFWILHQFKVLKALDHHCLPVVACKMHMKKPPSYCSLRRAFESSVSTTHVCIQPNTLRTQGYSLGLLLDQGLLHTLRSNPDHYHCRYIHLLDLLIHSLRCQIAISVALKFVPQLTHQDLPHFTFFFYVFRNGTHLFALK